MGRVLNSGPPPDPNALRRNRRDDQGTWTALPPHGLLGDIPDWPNVIEDAPSIKELAFWQQLWREKPQAHVWVALGMEIAVATYVRTALYAATVGARATYLTAVRQQSESLLLTPAALRSSRYRIKVDVADAPQDPDAAPAAVLNLVPPEPRGSSVLGRLGGASASGPQPVDDDVDDEDDDDLTDGDED